jgi:hypothetical protein
VLPRRKPNERSALAAQAVSELRARRSAGWSLVFRGAYRLLRLLDPLLRSWLANGLPGLDGIVEIGTVGARTGRQRSSLLTLLVLDGRGYVGPPNGAAAGIRNATAAGWLDFAVDGAPQRRAFTVLPDGRERDAVIRATWRQQPFPANFLYRAASRHVAAVGVFGRLDPLEAAR